MGGESWRNKWQATMLSEGEEQEPKALIQEGRCEAAMQNSRGVWEKDEIRKDDSFVTFEEIFDQATREKVDFVLLGGDLFHDNKPSRTTLVRTMEILSKYCLNGSQVLFKIISNPTENFVSGKANFKNDNYSVGLPVFTIHGNHDDPSGVDNLSAVDVLSTCNLVNYFGKSQLEGSTIGKLEIVPVLLQKGTTKIALYGLGNIRDERLARAFQTPGSVDWRQPKVTPQYPADEWFNIFVLHQNRVTRGQGAKNAIKEDYLPSFLDLVIWGHEHKCIPEPVAAESDKTFSILQPGSSVATALSEGEAKKKHVVVLEFLGEQWRTFKYPLRTVRPFTFDQIVLGDQQGLDPEKPEDVAAVIERKVAGMIAAAGVRSAAAGARSAAAGAEDAARLKLPLVRLRVDYTGFSTINAQRFGQKFVGRVANPHDMLLFHKAAARKAKPEVGDGEVSEADLRPEALDQQRVEQLLAEHLPENNVAIITRNEFTEALRDFVDKEEKAALAECVNKALAYSQSTAVQNGGTDKDEDIAVLLASSMKERRESQAAATPRQEPAAPRALGAAAAVRSNADLDLDDDDEAPSTSAMPPPPPQGRRRAAPTASRAGSHAPGAARGRRQATLGESFARGTPSQAEDGVIATQRSVASRGRKASPAQRPARKAATGARARMNEIRESEDELSGSDAADDIDEVDLIEDSDGEVDLLDEEPAPKRKRAAQGTLPVKRAKKEGPAQARASGDKRAAAGPVKGSFVEDSDSDAEAVPVTGRFGRRRLNMAGGGSAQQPSQVSGRAWSAAR
ncbi:DNA repair exonuclease [Coccomyxa subellipsoidea C-169]|uniref:DNA repair exonuclease n=1 Tax=Coccomyxa subellipsoidea (strain C-169) TaxID=574566 RepID=I0Z2B1_COCSC|nr:DNA repair exonuclease [Coccomyxa subellipsoidea C-169]EIE24780.1 DNA repair exonuclease [Coccomyxa subellipsoidea C-169]|eukprot:XP_005649324.1 DNA repair exonuclease [Coccomyxa subellipsoidea C-169]